jgi:FkbM family methyltransferase
MIRITEQLMKARITELLKAPNIVPAEPERDDSEFVRAAFQQILGRQPELDALVYFTEVLTTAPRDAVVEFLEQSEEARVRNAPESDPAELKDLCSIEPHRRFLIAAYARVFGRMVDQTGLEAYLRKFENGVSREQVLIELCTSAEGRAQQRKMTLHGQPIEELCQTTATAEPAEDTIADVTPFTLDADELLEIDDPADFLQAVYQGAFRRDPDAEGSAYWLATLGQTSKYSVLLEISRQAEAKQRGVSFRLRGVPIEQWDLSQLDTHASQGRFVWEAFQRILGRDCTVDEFAALLELLRLGVSRMQALAAIAASSAAARGPFYWHGQALPALDLPFSVRLRARLRRLLGPRHADVLEHSMCAQFAAMEKRFVELHDSDRTRFADLESAIASAQRSTIRLHEKLDTVRSELKIRLESLERAPTAGHPLFPVLAGHDVFVMKVDDFILAVPREDWPHAACYAYWGTVERGLGQTFRESLRPGMTVVDVGANIGIYTLHAARVVGDTGKVFSFEPTPRTFGILQGNVDANGFNARADLRCTAVLDKRSTMPFYVQDVRCGLNSLYGPQGGRSVMVETVSLDEALADVASIDLVKIDAEGSEPRIFRGMRRIVEANPALQMFVEFAPSLLLRAGTQPSDFLDELLAWGFDIQVVDDLSGELLPLERNSLLTAVSVNLSLRRAVA